MFVTPEAQLTVWVIVSQTKFIFCSDQIVWLLKSATNDWEVTG